MTSRDHLRPELNNEPTASEPSEPTARLACEFANFFLLSFQLGLRTVKRKGREGKGRRRRHWAPHTRLGIRNEEPEFNRSSWYISGASACSAPWKNGRSSGSSSRPTRSCNIHEHPWTCVFLKKENCTWWDEHQNSPRHTGICKRCSVMDRMHQRNSALKTTMFRFWVTSLMCSKSRFEGG